MQAALAHGYRLMNRKERFQFHKKEFEKILDGSDYWSRRVEEFPEMLDMVGV
jgi:hypothetical protein